MPRTIVRIATSKASELSVMFSRVDKTRCWSSSSELIIIGLGQRLTSFDFPFPRLSDGTLLRGVPFGGGPIFVPGGKPMDLAMSAAELKANLLAMVCGRLCEILPVAAGILRDGPAWPISGSLERFFEGPECELC